MKEELKQEAIKANNKLIPLGEDIIAIAKNVHDEDFIVVAEKERIEAVENQLYEVTNSLASVFQIIKSIMHKMDTTTKKEEPNAVKKGTLNIPIGTTLMGSHKGMNYFLQVKQDGYYVGETQYNSLSAAAQDVSNCRRSGLVFWKSIENGQSAKEAYK